MQHVLDELIVVHLELAIYCQCNSGSTVIQRCFWCQEAVKLHIESIFHHLVEPLLDFDVVTNDDWVIDICADSDLACQDSLWLAHCCVTSQAGPLLESSGCTG